MIVQENLRIFYHGSDKKFDSFSTRFSKRGKAIFITENKEDARVYGKFIYTIMLDPHTKLFDFRDWTSLQKVKDTISFLLIKEEEKPVQKQISFYPFTTMKAFEFIEEGMFTIMGHPLVIAALKKLKYDGYYEMENTRQEQIGILNVDKLTIVSIEE
jgi:hypothetical protein